MPRPISASAIRNFRLVPHYGLQMQLLHLLFADRSRRIHHQIDRLRGLRESNHLAQALRSSQNHHNPIQPEGNSAMRWRAILQSIQEEPEPLLSLGITHPERSEDLRLHILAVNTD